jgi:probable HAF family extracellular repeat protein
VVFRAERADSTVDEWGLSDTSIARIVARSPNAISVLARAPGTVTVKARRFADSGQATLLIPPAAEPTGWEVIDLGLLDAVRGGATAINESGVIVGTLEETSVNPVRVGFIYKDRVMHKLPHPAGVVYGEDPMAVGASGKIAGTAYNAGGPQFVFWDNADASPRLLSANDPPFVVGVNARDEVLANQGDKSLGAIHAMLLRQDGSVDLGALSVGWDGETYATAWNASGQIVGASKVAQIYHGDGDRTKVFHPILWENGVLRDLGVLASSCRSNPACGWGEATGINADGVIVGASMADSLFRAFIVENGVMRDLGAFPGQSTAALAINDRGEILGAVGSADFWDYGNTLFVWQNGHVQTIGIQVSTHPLFGPNGEVVGSTIVPGDDFPHIFIWQAGHVTDLGRGYAAAINSRGEIVGARGSIPTLWRRKRS